MNTQKKVFVSCAWPYANGSLHVGHLAAFLPSDIYARFHHLKGDDVLFVSGSDCHGTPISVRAEKEGITPEELSLKYHKEFTENFSKLSFSFNQFGLYTHTHTPEHMQAVQDIFLALYKAGFIEKRKERAMYDPEKRRFLPDRYIEGECPHCHFEQARGDQCDNCGSLLDPHELIKPISKLSSATPVEKDTEHFYFLLSNPKLQKKLRDYISHITHYRKNTKTYTENFLAGGLHDRAITRDLDWGVPLPKEVGEYPTKRIYVWFEAVCGYLSASKTWAKKSNAWEQFWINKNVQAYYVYGKDNIPFHTVMWPAILIAYSEATGQEYHLPDIHVSSEYVQIEGKKISTSRNWAVWIPDLLKDFTSDAIRYALIALNPESSDTNFSFKEFQAKNNNELLATLGNFIQRTLVLAKKAGLNEMEKADSALPEVVSCFKNTENALSKARIKNALSEIISLAQTGNKFLDDTEPWHALKSYPEKARKDISTALRIAVQFGPLLYPFLPIASTAICHVFSVPERRLFWAPYVKKCSVGELQAPLFTKIENEVISKHEEQLLMHS